jgi:cephalosporin hydroxylase
VAGAAGDAAARAAVAQAIGAAERVMVLFAPDAGDHLPLAALRGFSELVSLRGYLVFLGTAIGQPWLGYSLNWYKKTIETLEKGGEFAVDHSRTRQMVSFCPYGFLQRIGPVVSFSQDIFS